jgi:hypothetical protein
VSDGVSPFTILGGEGVVCEGDVCEIPPVDEQARSAVVR